MGCELSDFPTSNRPLLLRLPGVEDEFGDAAVEDGTVVVGAEVAFMAFVGHQADGVLGTAGEFDQASVDADGGGEAALGADDYGAGMGGARRSYWL